MTRATVILPTHNHEETLHEAIPSALEQTHSDLELFVVGDGVSARTREIVSEYRRLDNRVRFFDFEKGRRKGEAHRHAALQEATGRFVAYLGDDDIWLGNHLEVLSAAMESADLAATINTVIEDDGHLSFLAGDLENPAIRHRMLNELWNCFDFTFAAHTLDAYRRLPGGLATVPEDFPAADLFLWRQFLAEPWCRAKTVARVTALNTATHRRKSQTNPERARELSDWRRRSKEPGFAAQLERQALDHFCKELAGAQVPALVEPEMTEPQRPRSLGQRLFGRR